ncbi:MAG TPA: diguanylate cyclase [Rhodocyclaceae bacterium]|nr:diguanylate cyclase [Rhodocyclaceae bacterium]
MFSQQAKITDSSIGVRRSYAGLFLLGCFATLLLLCSLLWVSYQETEKRATLTARNTVEILEAHLNATFRRLQADLEGVAVSVPREAMDAAGIPSFRARLDRELAMHARQFPEILGYRIVDRNGSVLYTSQPDLPRSTAKGRSHFEELKNDPGKGLVFSEVAMGRISGRPLLFVAFPILDGKGQFLGMVTAPVQVDYFQQLFDAVDLGENAAITLRRTDNARLVLRRPMRPDAVNRAVQDNPMHDRILAGDKEGVISFVAHLDKMERIYAYRRVGDYPFYVAAGVASHDYLGAWRSTAVISLLACAGIMLALGIIMWRYGKLEDKEQKLARDLQKSEATYRSLLEAAPFPVVVADLDGAIIKYVNQRAVQWLHAEPDQLIGHSVRDLYPDPASRDRVVALLKEQGDVRDAEVELRQLDGDRRWAILSMELIDFDGEPCTFAAFSDISERKAAEMAMREANEQLQLQLGEIQRLQAALQEQAIRDSLTGLFNRRYLDETLEREVARSRREGSPLSLVLMDIDHFKRINDTYGHHAGDLALKAVADLLLSDVRAEDVVCRYGGEEFLILLPGMPVASAIERAEGWCRLIAGASLDHDGVELRLTASFGVAAYPEHARIPDQLTQCADRALYQAKREGRNRVAVQQPQVVA